MKKISRVLWRLIAASFILIATINLAFLLDIFFGYSIGYRPSTMAKATILSIDPEYFIYTDYKWPLEFSQAVLAVCSQDEQTIDRTFGKVSGVRKTEGRDEVGNPYTEYRFENWRPVVTEPASSWPILPIQSWSVMVRYEQGKIICD